MIQHVVPNSVSCHDINFGCYTNTLADGNVEKLAPQGNPALKIDRALAASLRRVCVVKNGAKLIQKGSCTSWPKPCVFGRAVEYFCTTLSAEFTVDTGILSQRLGLGEQRNEWADRRKKLNTQGLNNFRVRTPLSQGNQIHITSV